MPIVFSFHLTNAFNTDAEKCVFESANETLLQSKGNNENQIDSSQQWLQSFFLSTDMDWLYV